MVRAQPQKEAEVGAYSDDEGDSTIAAAYCSIGERGQKVSRRTLGEMEQVSRVVMPLSTCLGQGGRGEGADRVTHL